MENNEELNNSQHSLKWGAILGLTSIIVTLILYLIDIRMLIAAYMPFVLTTIFIGFSVYAGRDFRAITGGFMSFKNAFLHGFVVMAVGGFIGTVFDFILFNFIDPEVVPILVETQLNNAMKTMEAFGGAGDMMDQMADSVKKGFTLQGQAFGFLWKIVLYAIGALIVGAINKKKNQEEEF